jgi:dolichol-phosphate mannosyltransferase
VSEEALRGLVIIPTYNERDNLPRLIPLVLDQDERLDVLIIDDASPDGTGEVADELAAGSPRVHVIHRAGKLGLGTAYLAGFRWGLDRGYDWLFEMDADFSHDPAHLPQFIEALERLRRRPRLPLPRGPRNRRQLADRATDALLFANVYARRITGVPLWDATGGFKAFRRKVLEQIDLDRVESEGYSFQIEMNLRAPGSRASGSARSPSCSSTAPRRVEDVEEDHPRSRVAGLEAAPSNSSRAPFASGPPP